MEERMSFQKRFGIRVKELRKTRNLTQEELGLKTGLNYKYIGAVVERGERNLSLNSIKKIADGLQVETRILFDLTGVEVPEGNLPKTEKEKGIAKISKLLQNATLPKLRLAYKLLKTLFE